MSKTSILVRSIVRGKRTPAFGRGTLSATPSRSEARLLHEDTVAAPSVPLRPWLLRQALHFLNTKAGTAMMAGLLATVVQQDKNPLVGAAVAAAIVIMWPPGE